MSEVNRDKLLHDLRQVVHDAEELLRATAGQAREKSAAMRDRTDAFVRHNPWTAAGIGVAVGLLVGLLLGRRGGGSE